MKFKFTAVAILALVGNWIMTTPSQAANTAEVSTAYNCISEWGYSGLGYQGMAIKVYAPYAVTLISGTLPNMGAAANSGSVAITIYRDSAGTPGTALSGTLNQSAYASNLVTVTGSIAIPSAGYYWVQVGHTTASNDSLCYRSTVDSTGSAAGWTVSTGLKYGTAGSGLIATSWANFSSQYNFSIGFTLYSAGPASATLSATASVATFRSPTTLTATTSGTGYVAFYAEGKVIPTCKKIAVTVSSANCSWKPTVHKPVSLTALFTPTSGNAVKSGAIQVGVVSRTTKR